MSKEVLVTGGAGFIGSHLCDHLLENGYSVKVLDILDPQVHGISGSRPAYLNPAVELITGDIRNKECLDQALQDVDIVFHFAARIGVGQSMYQISDYTSVNNYGTAVLLEKILKSKVKKLIVASSMSIYGEGLYMTRQGKIVSGYERNTEDLKNGKWELTDAKGEMLQPIPTNEEKRPRLSSIYALSKYDQERMCLLTGRAYNIPVVALRFFNVYGSRQALSNPYTGVLAIFASRLLNGNSPLVYEDGNQKRDFINVKDVVAACLLACEKKEADGEVFNIGSGQAFTIGEIASRLAYVMNRPHLTAKVTSSYRVGDIRHCYADITKARQLLDFKPSVILDTGLTEFTNWISTQQATDAFEVAGQELEKRGLIV